MHHGKDTYVRKCLGILIHVDLGVFQMAKVGAKNSEFGTEWKGLDGGRDWCV